MSKGGGAATVSTYKVAVHFVLGMGAFDKILQFVVGEKKAWEGSAMDSTISIDAPELFGGNSREGGIQGDVDILSGKATQTVNPYLASVLGNNIPAYRQITSVVLKQVYIGTNYYLKPWWILGERVHSRLNGLTQWHDEIAEIGSNQGLMNIVHMIRECITDPYWGRGLPESLVDETSFYNAALTVYNEGLGFAVYWAQESTIEDFINELLKHIQASLYRDRKTGKYKLELIRKLTSTVGVFVIDDSNSKDIAEVKKKSIGDLVSQVEVKFINNLTHKDDTVIVSDPSLMSRQGEPKKDSTTYIACATKDVAHRLALRDLQQKSFPMIMVTGIETDRTAENLYVGAAFILNRPDYFPIPILMRVAQISLGDSISGRITIDAVQDNFQAADLVYPTLPSSGWINPIKDPDPALLKTVFEVPYYAVAKFKGDAYAQGLNPLKTFVTAAAASPSDISYSAGIWTTTGTNFTRKNAVDFCCTGVLASTINETDTVFTVSNLQDEELLDIGTYFKVENEFMGLVARTTNTFTVKRGVLDTIPAKHNSGTRFYGVEEYSATDNTIYFVGETVKVKLTPKTPKSEYPVASASQDIITLLGRMHLPYPPANVKINNELWPTVVYRTASSGSGTPDLNYPTRVLGLHFTGVDNSTTFTDNSPTPKTITPIGNAKIVGNVGVFDGNSDYLTIASSSAFNIGISSTYSAEFKFKANSLTTISGVIYLLSFTGDLSSNRVAINWNNSTSKFEIYTANNSVSLIGSSNSVSLSTGVTYHLAFVKNGTNTKLFLNGTIILDTNTITYPNINSGLIIASAAPFTSSADLDGTIDELYIWKDVAVYTSNFTPVSSYGEPSFYVNWSTRNRIQQTAGLIDWYAGNITPEANLTYTYEIRRTDSNALLDSGTSILPALVSSVSYLGEVNLKIWSVNANGQSYYPYSHTFTLTN